jgi:alpha-beta hydrolase superfamily lysophospholipase
MFRFWPEDYQWSFQLVRGMATAPWGGAEVGECLATAARITPGDYDGWHAEWLQTAERVEALGHEAEDRNQPVAARDAFGRASQYYRLAEFFLEPGDERKPSSYQRLHAAFRAYLPYAPVPPEPVEIPYRDTALPGLFVPRRRHSPGTPAPTVIVTGGLESLAEEVYFAAAMALSEWGFHAFVLDGPGQGESLRWRSIPAVAEFETAVTPAVDALQARGDVDPDRIALVGFSLGGYYVTRAAAFEHRLAALVIWGAQWDYGAVWQTREDDHPLARHLRMILGTDTMAEARHKVAAFRVGDVVGDIRCPTLVTHGQHDEHVPVDHAHRTYEALRCPKDLKVFTSEEGGSAHCQWDNLRVAHKTMFGWLSDALG